VARIAPERAICVRVTDDAEALRHEWVTFCTTTSKHYADAKFSEGALDVIAARYESLTADERVIVDRLLIEQLVPKEPVADEPWYVGENERFDALFLVNHFEIVSAVPALRILAEWLEHQSTPGAPYEWAKVNRIIGRLAALGA
jgi:hypothetical protein